MKHILVISLLLCTSLSLAAPPKEFKELCLITHGNLEAFKDFYKEHELEQARFHLKRAENRLHTLQQMDSSSQETRQIQQEYDMLKYVYEQSTLNADFYQVMLMALDLETVER